MCWLLQREVRAKDQRLEEVKAELAKVAARERQQMEQLMTTSAPPSSSYSGVMDSKLHQQLTLVLTRYKELEHEHQDTKAQLEAAQRSLVLTCDLEARYAELEQAHMVQAVQVQQLQRERQQVAELKVRSLRVWMCRSSASPLNAALAVSESGAPAGEGDPAVRSCGESRVRK